MAIFKDFGKFLGFDVDSDEEKEQEEALPNKPDEKVSYKRKQKASADTDKANIQKFRTTTQLEVVLVKPERFDDASAAADQLLSKRTVILNLESTEKEQARRMLDFLSGVAYANNGKIQRVANSTFIITPNNVGVVGDLLDELENSGVFFC